MKKEGFKSRILSNVEEKVVGEEVFIHPWLPEEAELLYEALEKPNWAPWLAASAEILAGRSKVFPYGQLVMKDGTGKYMASLSLNQIIWNGDITTLPTWDEVAGDPTDYSATYDPHGNALVLLSMNVAPQYQGKRLPTKMIEKAKQLAQTFQVDHLISSFRPSGFGEAKKQFGHDINFAEYCFSTQPDSGRPIDPWLRSLSWSGMQMLTVDHNAMTVQVSLSEFKTYMESYHADRWRQIHPYLFECGEVGSWVQYPGQGIAVYKESNVWGRIPIK